MSGIVLSASVRQNLLSLQSTAALLATTQNDLATGNKVNSALDNPTSYFTAAALNNRASDIGNLLDSIGNGVQVLQAANTGITSLQSLVANAQSIANQVLQAPTGYTTKSSVTATAITGATANNLLGPRPQQHRHRFGHSGREDSDDDHREHAAGRRQHHGRRPHGRPPTVRPLPIDGKTHHRSPHRRTTTTTSTAAAMSRSASDGSTATIGTVLGADRRHHRCDAGCRHSPLAQARPEHRNHAGPDRSAAVAGTLTALGLTAATTPLTPPAISGQTLQIASTGGGTATTITFGTGTGQVSTLNEFNTRVGGEQPAGQHRYHRCDHHHDHEQRRVGDDRRIHRQHRNAVQPA